MVFFVLYMFVLFGFWGEGFGWLFFCDDLGSGFVGDFDVGMVCQEVVGGICIPYGGGNIYRWL